jgi:hypothetical protein
MFPIMTNELLRRRSGRIGGFLFLLLLLGGVAAAATRILCEGDSGTDGEAEAERQNDKLLHFVVISFD